jgi:hypothetical protein
MMVKEQSVTKDEMQRVNRILVYLPDDRWGSGGHRVFGTADFILGFDRRHPAATKNG